MRRSVVRKALFLGFDSSTQGLKASAVNESLQVVYSCAINYDADLPSFGTSGGAHVSGSTVTAPSLMFASALDTVLEKMETDGFAFSDVVAISGSGQQHGSVFLKEGSRAALGAANASAGALAPQLDAAGIFARPDSPIWMDSSTGAQCAQLEDRLGGAAAVAALTGSRAFERFTGNQIAKVYEQTPQVYEQTERVALISSFMCSLLVGDYAPIDTSDGAGMNLMDLQRQAWSDAALDATAPELKRRLGDVVPAHTVVGSVSPYMSARYGFSPQCSVVAWSGDNPNSVAGLGIRDEGDVGISLGTSDTLFSIVSAAASVPSVSSHTFVNPVDPASHMVMLCVKNGSLAREAVCARVAGGDWDAFNALVASTPAGNDGNVGFFFEQPEIVPHITTAGVRRFDGEGGTVESFATPAIEARAVLEGQLMSMRSHAEAAGLVPKRLIATGGASANVALVQVIADVFGAPVFASTQTDSASLGAAYRALHGDVCAKAAADGGAFVSYAELTADATNASLSLAATPDDANHGVYSAMLRAYNELVARVVAEDAGSL
jgi:xylulokinase